MRNASSTSPSHTAFVWKATVLASFASDMILAFMVDLRPPQLAGSMESPRRKAILTFVDVTDCNAFKFFRKIATGLSIAVASTAITGGSRASMQETILRAYIGCILFGCHGLLFSRK